MNNPCPQVTSLSALLSLLQLRQSCRWPVQQGVELLALCGERGRELMLNLQPAFQPSGLYQRLLSRRAQQLEIYDGCYLCLNHDRVLSCWRQLPESAMSDKQHIAQLFSLAGIHLAD
ncbi:HrpV family type III secretion system protein [Erwinia amylovora]|uniref:Type III secretion protein HrpV n=4 Tax=Erwinia amylovora TaxID=552 RepID=A0A831EPX3_ERWAM|nr:HrpV family type III secretion system protein [Erwinia amylovora]CBX79369.1 Type III secretion protein HrpV [Erwinia amylovora ATCC BAA-2158]CCP01846.1 Type III secretion protein HrpV [Erwinia amylovora Ea644]CCP05870.1 Type III secretion protein HrpV [Erwinia amylovora MR1]CDK14150.1 Type III secretion protein HrpV [Erwinia amylovora LA635]CDK17517.1 Type III secretion protein HrpV [Erwinia amylovora LA636]CDK20886.1 Type III secretion protein HrpV [Erwinia amylovora LA637]